MNTLNISINKNKIFEFFLALFIITIPLWREINTFFLWPLLLSWIIFIPTIEKKENFQLFKKQIALFLIFFFLFVISLFWTKNIERGLLYLDSHFGLIFIPLILLSINNKRLSLKRFLIYLGFGINISIIICEFNVVADIINSQDPLEQMQYFFKWIYMDWNFVRPLEIHPTIISIIVSFYLICIIFYYQDFNFKSHKFFLITQYLICSLFLFQASSRISLLSVTFLIVFFLIKKNDIGLSILILIFTSLTIFIFYKYGLFDFVFVKFSKITSNGEITFERYFRWKGIINEFLLDKKSIFFGLGPGDTRVLYNKTYLLNDFQEALNGNYNAHNQFLELFVGLGLIGVVIYILILISIFRKSTINGLSLIFFIFFVGLSSTESFLDRSKGVFIFCVFYSIVLQLNEKNSCNI